MYHYASRVFSHSHFPHNFFTVHSVSGISGCDNMGLVFGHFIYFRNINLSTVSTATNAPLDAAHFLEALPFGSHLGFPHYIIGLTGIYISPPHFTSLYSLTLFLQLPWPPTIEVLQHTCLYLFIYDSYEC